MFENVFLCLDLSAVLGFERGEFFNKLFPANFETQNVVLIQENSDVISHIFFLLSTLLACDCNAFENGACLCTLNLKVVLTAYLYTKVISVIFVYNTGTADIDV